VTIKTYSVDEVAESLYCTPRWLTDQVRTRRFPARKIARHWRFTESDVQTIFALCANGFEDLADTATWSAATPVASGLTQRSRKRVMGL
jgi:hypothetical protein